MPAPDLGPPIAWPALPAGVPVLAADGEEAVGEVRHVLGDQGTDIFDGLVIDVDGTTRFADAPEVQALHERGAILTLSEEQIRRLPEPSANPPVVEAGVDDVSEDGLAGKLRRAWDLLSGNY